MELGNGVGNDIDTTPKLKATKEKNGHQGLHEAKRQLTR